MDSNDYYFFKFKKNFVDEIKQDIPFWILNKRFMCIECGGQPIYLNTTECPYPTCGYNTDISLNVGVSVLLCLKKYCGEQDADSRNPDLRNKIINAIKEALPVVSKVPNDIKIAMNAIDFYDSVNKTNMPILAFDDSETYPKRSVSFINFRNQDYFCMEDTFLIHKTEIPKMCIIDNSYFPEFRVGANENLDLFKYDSSKCEQSTYDEFMQNHNKFVFNEKNMDNIILYYCNMYNNNRKCKNIPQYISKISVKNLFYYHSYQLCIKNDLSIIYGSNALGKTTAFKILEYCLIADDDLNKINERLKYLFAIPFSEIKVEFRNDYYVEIIKQYSKQYKQNVIKFSYISFGFDEINDVFLYEKDNETKSRALFKHYKNIERLFPNILKRKFLFVNVNRINDVNALKYKMIKFLENTKMYKLKQIDYFEKELENMVKPSFGDDFSKEAWKVCTLLKRFVTLSCSPVKKNVYLSEVFTFFKNNYDEIVKGTFKVEFDWGEKFKQNSNYKPTINEALSSCYAKFFNKDNTVLMTAIEFYRKFKLFKEKFESFYYEFDPSRKHIVFKDGKLQLQVNKTLNGDFSGYLEFGQLSSGELNIATILYNLIFKTETSSIVLMDEPELSLHVEWQKLLPEVIKDIMKENGGMQVIIASHSPFLTMANEDCFVWPELINIEGDSNG